MADSTQISNLPEKFVCVPIQINPMSSEQSDWLEDSLQHIHEEWEDICHRGRHGDWGGSGGHWDGFHDGVTVFFSLNDDNDNVNNDGFFLQAWERVTTQWRVVGGSSLHNNVEVFTNKKLGLC